jgi:hypothetical protein
MNANPSPRWTARWSVDEIRALLLEQRDAFWRRDTGIPREQLAALERAATSPHAVVISGLRRAGKSTLLAQLAHRLGPETFYYVNFEDERLLGFTPEDANDLYGHLVALFGDRRIWLLDEVQNVSGWERFVRRLMDAGHKFHLTGSNASLLSRDLGTRLTGRYVPVALFPFSFREYLRFRSHTLPDLDRLTTVDQAHLQRWLAEYLREGGLPEPLLYPDLPLRETLYNDILYRDIVARHGIGDVRALQELAFYLMSHPASLISYNSLRTQLGLGSSNTVRAYLEHLEASWLIFALSVYDYSVKRQQITPKKVYGIDTGLLQDVGFHFSPNTGRLLENLVFLALRRKTHDIHYYASPQGTEVDFYLPAEGLLIQVAQQMEHPATRDREVRALTAAMQALHLESGLILTDANQEPIVTEGGAIAVRSMAGWLLEPS